MVESRRGLRQDGRMNTPQSLSGNPKPYGACAPNALQRAVICAAHRTGLKRGAFRPTMSRLVNLFGEGPIDATYQGASFRFYHQDSGTERGALFNPNYNQTELDFLRAHTPEGGTFIDVGANVGIYALALAHHIGTNGTVVAIEPHPLANERLAFNKAASQFRNLVIVAAAAGDTEGTVTLATDIDNLGASSVSESQGGIKVPAHKLLTILQHAGVAHVDALKIDVEGYEDRVLISFFRDAPQSLWPRAIAIEHLEHDVWRQDCIADMVSRGYIITGKTRSNTLLVRS